MRNNNGILTRIDIEMRDVLEKFATKEQISIKQASRSLARMLRSSRNGGGQFVERIKF